MNRASPERGNARPRPGKRAPKRYLRHVSYRAKVVRANAKLDHWGLLLDRYAIGLLQPFVCHRCNCRGLDPYGRNGKREWLCQVCADPAMREAG
jgi:hypothetical protein